MEATPDPTPSRRDVLGVDNHPKSFNPVYETETADERNEKEAAEKAAKILAERKAAEAAKAAEEKAR